MSSPRRLFPLICIATLLVAVFIITGLDDHRTSALWKDYNNHVKHAQSAAAAATAASGSRPPTTTPSFTSIRLNAAPSGHPDPQAASPQPGRSPFPASKTHTLAMVVPCTKNENTSWIGEELPGLETVIYTADDPDAPLHPPRNKGHEAMIYLTYMIDFYDALPDIVLFMHAHRWTYHNNDLQGSDAVQLIKTLSGARVMREGYMNLRCHWEPGCPGHLHPAATATSAAQSNPDLSRLRGIVADQWPKLFPADPIPETLSQPCCAQFAVTRAAIRANPRRRYVAFRDWLLHTPLTDYYSGRIWEYLWHFVFTGKTVLCPEEHVCYCDGFGICFGGREEYGEFRALMKRREEGERELRVWEDRAKEVLERQGQREQQQQQQQQHDERGGEGEGEGDGDGDEEGKDEKKMDVDVEMPEMGKDVFLRDQIDALNRELDDRREQAVQRGRDPKNRAVEAGRDWNEGDGF
ncbi:MAG: hypothetical protein M1816_003776 [Peltula sp. TS41687]|nr:MAG: hypothetical protein M1816_003776 [Peltula sp. TS41687]